MSSRELTVVIAGDARRIRAALGDLGRDLDRVGSAADANAGRWSRWSTVAASAGAMVAAGLVASLQEAIKFESAMAGVAKTVDATAAEMAVLEQGIVSMGNRLPASREQIAGVAEAAGQLGISKDHILEFTEVAIALGVSTNLAADEAATGLARLANVMGTSEADFDRLGSTLVDLGNKGASTESEILDMAQRLSGIGSTVGATEAEVLALANAMSSMGIEAELGGGAMQRMMIKIEAAAATGGDAVAEFARVAGMSSEQFVTAWGDSPVETFQAIVDGLAGVQDAGGNVIGLLDDMGIKGTQNRQVMLRLIGANDTLAQSLDDGRAAWQENTALAEEAGKRYETAASQLTIFKNQVTNIAREVGTELIPPMLDGLDLIRDVGEAAHDAGEAAEPVWDDLVRLGRNLRDVAGDVYDGLEPVLDVLVRIGGGAVAAGVAGTADVLGDVSGFLSDHGDIVRDVATAWAALKVAAISATAWTAISTGIGTATASLVAMKGAIDGIAATRGVSTLTAGLGVAKESARGLGGTLSSMASSAGPVVVLAVGIYAVVTAMQNAKDQANELADSLIDVEDDWDLDGMATSLANVTAELSNQMEEWHDYDGVGGIVRGTVEILTPLENKVYDNAVAVKELTERQNELAGSMQRIEHDSWTIANTLGLSQNAVLSFMRSLELVPGVDSIDDMQEAILDAAIAASSATPQTDSLAGAYGVLASEASSATDELDAYKEIVDSILGVQLSAFEAQTRYGSALDELTEAIKANGRTLDIGTEKGRENRDALQGAAEAALGWAESLAAQGDTQGALNTMTMLREQIVGIAADLLGSRSAAEEFVASAGLTDEALADIAAGVTDPSAALEGLQEQLDVLGGTVATPGVEVDAGGAFETMSLFDEEFMAWVLEQRPDIVTHLDTSTATGRMEMLDVLLRQYAASNPTAAAWLDSQPAEVQQRALEAWMREWDAMRGLATVGVAFDESSAAAAQRRVDEFASQRHWIDIGLRVVGGDVGTVGGGVGRNRWGGVYSFARGGVTPAHIAHGDILRYAEAETGGEAFIPRLGDPERSLSILRQAAAWYGADIVERKRVSMSSTSGPLATASSARAGVEIDYERLGRAVADALADRPPVVELDGEQIGRSRRVYAGISRQADQDRRGRR